MDEIQARRQAVIIAKRGKPVAKLVPVEKEKDDIFGLLKGEGTVLGDVSEALTPASMGHLCFPSPHTRRPRR